MVADFKDVKFHSYKEQEMLTCLSSGLMQAGMELESVTA